MTTNKTLYEARNLRCHRHREDRYFKHGNRKDVIAWKYGKALPSLPQAIAEQIEYEDCPQCGSFLHDVQYCPMDARSFNSFYDDLYGDSGSYHNGLWLRYDSDTGTASCGLDGDSDELPHTPYDHWDDILLNDADRFYDEWYNHSADTAMQYST